MSSSTASQRREALLSARSPVPVRRFLTAIVHTGRRTFPSQEVSKEQMPPTQPWSAFTSTDEAHRRASGRRRYNAVRRFNADVRRIEVERLLMQYGFATRGARARVARKLKVHPSTITKDLRRIPNPDDGKTCPTCERWMSQKAWDQLQEDEAAYCRSVLSWQNRQRSA
jgi:hypothetical protein